MKRILLILIPASVFLLFIFMINTCDVSSPSDTISSSISPDNLQTVYEVPCLNCSEDDLKKLVDLRPYFDHAIKSYYHDAIQPLFFKKSSLNSKLCLEYTDKKHQFYDSLIFLDYLLSPEQYALYYPIEESLFDEDYGTITGKELAPYYFCNDLNQFFINLSIYEYLEPKLDAMFPFPYIFTHTIQFAGLGQYKPDLNATIDSCEVYYPGLTKEQAIHYFLSIIDRTIYIGINKENIKDFDIEKVKLELRQMVLPENNHFFSIDIKLYTFEDITKIQPYELYQTPKDQLYQHYHLTRDDLCKVLPCTPSHLISDRSF